MLQNRHEGDNQTRIVEEMGIWSGSVRIDVATINGEIHGFELKSASDTLDRLQAQAELYSQVFDRVTLVTAERHICAATQKVPDWWGVVLAYMSQRGDVELREIAPSGRNQKVIPLQLARLLWRTEALAILTKHGFDRGVRTRSVEIIAQRLADSLSLEQLGTEVRNILKHREGWLGQPISN
jgi:hypothetical protein